MPKEGFKVVTIKENLYNRIVLLAHEHEISIPAMIGKAVDNFTKEKIYAVAKPILS